MHPQPVKEVTDLATSIIPKSEFRRNENISVGYGEVPAISVNGVTAWGLPGGEITFSEETALEWAIKLNKAIQANIRSVEDLEYSRYAK